MVSKFVLDVVSEVVFQLDASNLSHQNISSQAAGYFLSPLVYGN